MSLHINITPAARDRLARQRRLNAASSVIISLLVLTLVGLFLALVMLPGLIQEHVQIVTYDPPVVHVNPPQVTKPTNPRMQPSAPSAPSQRVIVSSAASDFSVSVPNISLDLGFLGGSAENFGDGWAGNDAGTGNGNGADGGGFGSTYKSSGGLEGALYDFKQKPNGEEVAYNLSDPSEFVDRILRLQRSKFSDAALSKYFQAPQRLYLTHLAISNSPASSGPKFFGAEGVIKPSGWIARYHGKVIVPKDATYRFSGIGDDFLTVSVNRRLQLVACWPDIHPAVAGRWDASQPTGQFTSPYGVRLVYGDWIRLRKGEVIDVDVVIGERPGGKVGFLLHIEEKDAQYRKDPNGRPILPLFATVMPDEAERSKISREFGSYEIEWENAPTFPVQP